MKLSASDCLRYQLIGYSLSFAQEYKFSPLRKWRADFALPKEKPIMLVEVEGGIWLTGGGRHNRAKGYQADIEKYNAATLLGYRVFRFTTEMVNDGTAIDIILKAMGK